MKLSNYSVIFLTATPLCVLEAGYVPRVKREAAYDDEGMGCVDWRWDLVVEEGQGERSC